MKRVIKAEETLLTVIAVIAAVFWVFFGFIIISAAFSSY